MDAWYGLKLATFGRVGAVFSLRLFAVETNSLAIRLILTSTEKSKSQKLSDARLRTPV
jgi:hypothetical protein